MEELQPDLVAVNEAIQTDDYDQVREFLGDGFHVAHQRNRELGDGGDVEPGQGHSLASRWPITAVHEVDLHVTPRTEGFACGLLVAEIQAPDPFGPIVFAYHNPNWQPAYARERELQAVAAASFLDQLVGKRNLHVVMAADLDSDPSSSSARFWTGRQSLEGASVCYRDAWESAHPGESTTTFGDPANPLVKDWDWPFRQIDYIFVRCGEHGGPTLQIRACARVFDRPIGGVWASDHYGLYADLAMPNQFRGD
jgi:endonuclease/exonuclease/phosphatase family metal-dependent hydrolase